MQINSSAIPGVMIRDYYESFYNNNWHNVYDFWHTVTNRTNKQEVLLAKVLKRRDQKELRVLDLGCGAGDEIKKAITTLSNNSIAITANDSSREALLEYKKNNKPHVKRIICGRLENIPKQVIEKFDLVLFSHCLYNIRLYNNLLRSYDHLLSPAGYILIFHESKDSDLIEIRNKFWRKIYRKDYAENTAEDIVDALNQGNHTYQIKKIPYTLNLGKLRGRLLEEKLIPFLFRAINIPQRISQEIKKDILSRARNNKINCLSLSIFSRPTSLKNTYD